MSSNMKLTQAVVQTLLDYDLKTGVLTWKQRGPEWFKPTGYGRGCYQRWNAQSAGQPALTARSDGRGYLRGELLGHKVFAHRIIFLWMTGRMPKQVDHNDGDLTNNRWDNLNATDHWVNSRNQKLRNTNTSGVNGVCWDAKTRKWKASVWLSGKNINLGRFINKEDAIAARQRANSHYGYNPNHGRSASL